MKTILYKVTYKTEPNRPQHHQEFHHEQAALAFAFSIEVDGGVAVLTKVEKIDPLARSNNPDLDFYN